jgi:hypothetical protein
MGKKSWKSWKEDAAKSKISKLDNWKKDGSVVVWLHTKSGIYQKGQHFVPYISHDSEKNKDEIKWLYFNCHEEYETLRFKQEPECCPIELFIDWLECNDSIEDDDLVWECEVGKLNKSMTKYDFIENWMTKMKARLTSVLPIINDKDPKEIIVTEETIAIELGTFKAIDDYGKVLLESGEDIDLSDPDINPYPFKWEYNAKTNNPNEKYNVIALDRKEPTDDILELLNGPEVDLSSFIKPGDSKRLRKIMEDHIVLEDVPFDEIFANVKDKESNSYNYKSTENENKDIEVKEEVKEKTEKKSKKSKKEKPEVQVCPDCGEPLPLDENGNPEVCDCQYEEVYECDVCGAEVSEDAEECENCKRIEEEKKKKEKKKPAKRRRVKK